MACERSLRFFATAGKITCQFFGLSFLAVDISIDRFVADTHRLIIACKTSRKAVLAFAQL